MCCMRFVQSTGQGCVFDILLQANAQLEQLISMCRSITTHRINPIFWSMTAVDVLDLTESMNSPSHFVAHQRSCTSKATEICAARQAFQPFNKSRWLIDVNGSPMLLIGPGRVYRANELDEAVDDLIHVIKQTSVGLMPLPLLEDDCLKLCTSYATKYCEVGPTARPVREVCESCLQIVYSGTWVQVMSFMANCALVRLHSKMSTRSYGRKLRYVEPIFKVNTLCQTKPQTGCRHAQPVPPGGIDTNLSKNAGRCSGQGPVDCWESRLAATATLHNYHGTTGVHSISTPSSCTSHICQLSHMRQMILSFMKHIRCLLLDKTRETRAKCRLHRA